MSDDNCLDAAGRDSPVKLVRCHGMGGNQAWNYNDEVSYIYLWKAKAAVIESKDKIGHNNMHSIIFSQLGRKW